MKDYFNKPSVVITNSNNLLKGSARSIQNYNIGRVIKNLVDKDILINGGGHNYAAGFTLKKENIQSTFFLVGKNVEKYPKLVKQIIKNGHEIGNHSYSHKNGWLCNNKAYLDDIEKCQQLIPENKLFRPPYGKITSRQIAALKSKYKIILWDILPGDFQTKKNPDKIKKTILKKTKSGSIIVLHNNNKSFMNLKPILTETIQSLKKRGFSFSTTW